MHWEDPEGSGEEGGGKGDPDGGSGWGIHVNPWLSHVNVWQKLLKYCKVISLQLIKINEKKKKEYQLCRIPFKELWPVQIELVDLVQKIISSNNIEEPENSFIFQIH